MLPWDHCKHHFSIPTGVVTLTLLPREHITEPYGTTMMCHGSSGSHYITLMDINPPPQKKEQPARFTLTVLRLLTTILFFALLIVITLNPAPLLLKSVSGTPLVPLHKRVR